MNDANRKRGWLGVFGGAGLALLLAANATNIMIQMVCGAGALGLGIPLALIFGGGAYFFGRLAYQKARYLSCH